jgi:hypothetical protein
VFSSPGVAVWNSSCFFVRLKTVSPSRPEILSGAARSGGQDWPQATAAGGVVLTPASTAPRLGQGRRSICVKEREERSRSSACGRAHLAHQLISGSSMTACHDPSCTAQTTEEAGSHFLPAMRSPIQATNTAAPLRASSDARRSETSIMVHAATALSIVVSAMTAPSGMSPVST